jgi:anaerobic magnesium-protoporphyrin IX monomethyl ester cyclase
VDVESYRATWTDTHGRFSWNMISSRGCPFGCNWCAKPISADGITQRSPENVARRNRAASCRGASDHIWFADDIFGLTAEVGDEVCDEVVARGARTPFMIQCRADLLTPDVVQALAKAGAERCGSELDPGRSAFSMRWTRYDVGGSA